MTPGDAEGARRDGAGLPGLIFASGGLLDAIDTSDAPDFSTGLALSVASSIGPSSSN
jgi:hypothetical protein